MADAPRTHALAEFISELPAGGLPESVMAATSRTVFDGAGALLAAANPAYSTGRLITAFAREQGGSPEASVVGAGFRTGSALAALANGTMGYACDVEPYHPEAILHPIAVMLPASLAVAERTGASGLDFLAAVAIGCEVEYRVSMALGPAEQYALGFHPSAVCGAFGAAAAAARLLALTPEAVVRTLGLAACQASGMMAWESDPTENARPFQMGVAARNGVTSALLAAAGFGGPTAVFDHGHTVFGAFSRNPKPERLTADLATRYEGVTELAIKAYPCVAFLHPGLDALLGLMREHALSAAEIQSITLRFAPAGLHCIDGNPLKSHCAQYVLPVAAVDGRLSVADFFIDRRIADPAIADLCRRVHVMAEPELDALFPDFYPTVVEVKLHSGRTLERRKDIARGYPEMPLSDAEIESKFDELVATVAAPETAARLKAALRELRAASDVTELAATMREPSWGTRG